MRILSIILFIVIALGGCAKSPYPYVADEVMQPDGTTTIHIRDLEVVDTSWTKWNLFWATAAVTGAALDVHSTVGALNRGCHEENPIYGSDPSTGVLVLGKLLGLGIVYAVTEYVVAPEDRQELRNYGYAPLALLNVGVAAHNYGLNCD